MRVAFHTTHPICNLSAMYPLVIICSWLLAVPPHRHSGGHHPTLSSMLLMFLHRQSALAMELIAAMDPWGFLRV